jgi:hypothetical protein
MNVCADSRTAPDRRGGEAIADLTLKDEERRTVAAREVIAHVS